jgi:hypothetical protein
MLPSGTQRNRGAPTADHEEPSHLHFGAVRRAHELQHCARHAHSLRLRLPRPRRGRLRLRRPQRAGYCDRCRRSACGGRGRVVRVLVEGHGDRRLYHRGGRSGGGGGGGGGIGARRRQWHELKERVAQVQCVGERNVEYVARRARVPPLRRLGSAGRRRRRMCLRKVRDCHRAMLLNGTDREAASDANGAR